MGDRHHILYDVERWRRYRTWLLLPATVFVMTAVFLTLFKPQSGAAFGYVVAAVALLAVASSLWTRQRFTYLAQRDETLLVRTMAARQSLGREDIERARVVKLSAVFHRPDRRQLLPRPADRWLAMPAIAINLRDGFETRSLSRLLGARALVDGALVVPVADPEGLLADLLEHVCPPRAQPAPGGSRRRGRRR